MVYLFPRLLTGAAKELRETFLGQSPQELRSHAELSHTAMFYAATGGVRLPTAQLRDLRATIVQAAEARGFPAPHNRKQAAMFDIAAAEILHRDSGIIPAEAVAGDLWAFLSLVAMPDVAAWRYTDLHRDRVLGTDVTRHVFGRLWWRAHLVHDSEAEREDLYAALSVLGESAFDQIYARRTSIGGSPHLVRGILRVWQAIDVPRDEVSERDFLRDLLKRVLRLQAFISFDSLSSNDLDEELGALADESLRAMTQGA
ncbi:hypothetical protein P3T37_002183 [Kitasatospora sp. MAA4]|uniref:DUF6339 family protein n=1 Tax=Kitasatospora sp. MAA4 TaxID=3035093 RepID=UPI0024749923|nr:DUF6339 family protein [Kitasatospora sp. MAA4]MDH6132797.1 hypothetical protein [Kitasatospora sp. MAA4]